MRATKTDALLLLPMAVAVAFVHAFARALSMTDEWVYVHALRRLHDVDFSSLTGWREALRLYPWRFSEHNVTLPFVLYAPMAEATHYDSRWQIALTVAAFAGQTWLYRATMVRSAWAALPIALVVFCPSHYMEFLWGWQLTLTLSVALSLAGLVAIGAMEDGKAWSRLTAGLGLLSLGVLSSAGAFFGFASAMLIVAVARIDWRTKRLALATCAVAAVLVYALFMQSGPRRFAPGWREAMHVCTALGATLWGSPVGLFEFGLDVRSAGGLAIAVLTAVVVGRAAVLRALPEVALPLGVALMGFLCLGSIALARPYLGNWHLQYALPALCGGYAAAHALWRLDRTAWSGVPFFGLSALLVSSVLGYHEGFTTLGPQFHGYARSIEDHQFRNLVEPGLPPPYPAATDMDARLFLFLAAHGHPCFATQPPLRPAGSLPGSARVFHDEAEVPQTPSLEGGRGKVSLLTVVVPGPTKAGGVEARIGGEVLRLWRVHPDHVPAAARVPGAICFMAVIVPHRLPAGRHRVDFDMLE